VLVYFTIEPSSNPWFLKLIKERVVDIEVLLFSAVMVRLLYSYPLPESITRMSANTLS
jgi:ABC-type cobalt transport system substrate-binding protein